jgi:glycosyltransferase involved in cell wall biosynthesis
MLGAVVERPAARVSVVIPVWDRHVRFLAEARASVAEQRLVADVLVVDNSSTSEIAVPDAQRTTVFRTPRRLSVGAARNAGLARVTTPLVCFLDADDRLLPGALAALCDRLDAAPQFVGAVRPALIWDPVNGLCIPRRWPRALTYCWAGRRRLAPFLGMVRNPFPVVGSSVWRTAAVRDAGGFPDAEVDEDAELAALLLLRGPVALERVPGRLYRRHGASLTARPIARSERRRARRRIRGRLREDPRATAAQRAVIPLVAVVHHVTARRSVRIR